MHSTADHANGSDSAPLTVETSDGNGFEVQTETDLAAKLSSLGLLTGAVVEPGDRTSGRGDDEFA